MLLSACIIVKNEERYIRDLLDNLTLFVDEIILVDTGSTDSTLEIAAEYDLVFLSHFDWCEDFSKARNASLSLAKSEWIIVLDADERLSPQQDLRKLLEDTDVDAFSLVCKNLQPKGSLVEAEYSNIIRLFRNRKGYSYQGSIHEQILPSILEKNGRVERSRIEFVHLGYATSTVQGNVSRQERNIHLLEEALQTQPDDMYLRYQLGVTLQATNPLRAQTLLIQAGDYFEQKEHIDLLEQIYYKLAQIFLEQNMFEHCLHCANLTLQLNSNNIPARMCLVIASIQSGQLEDAKIHIQVMQQNNVQVGEGIDLNELMRVCNQLPKM